MAADALDETPAPETAAAAAPAPAPTGLKATANDLVMKAYLKAPPKAQTAMLNGFVKAQPAVSRAKRFAKPAAVSAAALLVLRTARRRKG